MRKGKKMARFKVKLKTKKVYLKGSPVKVTVEIKNNTNLNYYILRDELALDETDCDCFIIRNRGQEAEYDGFLVKRGAPTEKSYLLLKAGEKLVIPVNLAHNYKLDKTGYYTVRFKRKIHFVRDLQTDLLEGTRSEDAGCREKGFFLVGRKRRDGLTTIGERERGEDRNRQKNAGSGYYQEPEIKFYDSGKTYPEETKEKFKKYTLKAHYTMVNYLYYSRRELLTESIQPENLHYGMVFGAYDKTRYEAAKGVYDKVEEAVRRDKITYIYREMEKDNIFGYTTKGSRTIYLCQAYMQAALTGEDSKMGTILHELTHAAADTDDVCYGRGNCRNLAKNKPEDAIKNADSFEFFLESKFLNRMTEEKWAGTENAEKTEFGGPSLTWFGEKQLYLFYLDKSGVLQQAVYDKETKVYSPSGTVTDASDTPLTSIGHPETIVFRDKMYLFFLDKTGKELKVSTFLGEKWTVPLPVTVRTGETAGAVKPAYVSQPVIYRDEINFIYREEDGEDIYWIAGDGETWRRETKFQQVNKYRYHPAICVYKKKLYLFYQIQHNEKADESENRKIYYAYYREAEEVWSENHSLDQEVEGDKASGRRACIPTDAYSAIRAENCGDVVYLVYRGNDSEETVQIQMGYNVYFKEKLFWTDFEKVGRSSVEGADYKQRMSCAIAGDNIRNYVVYQKTDSDGVYISTQIRG